MKTERTNDTATAAGGNGLAPHVEPYLADHEAFAQGRPATDSDSVRGLRQSAIEHFARNGFPSVRLEEWRFTNVEGLEETEFRLAGIAPSSTGAADTTTEGTTTLETVKPHLLDGAHNLVFVNGRFSPGLSSAGELADGLVVESLGDALVRHADTTDAHLGRHADLAKQPFVALNTAFVADGGFVHAARGVVEEKPIHLLHVSTGGQPLAVSYPRNLVVAEESAQLTVVETYIGSGTYFTCAVTEVAVGPNAVVDHYKVQDESVNAYHMAMLQLDQSRDSTFASHSISTGGRLVRYDANAYLGGEGVSSTLNGLYLARGTQHVDNHMWVEHAKPHGYSHELYKGILEGEASAVFTGRIYVHEGAQGTDAVQSNRNLLLSPEALANSNPQLEIFADDVRCTHGSTIGQLDPDSIFYLRSRGIGEEAARSLLIYAFASDIVAGIKVEAVRTSLERYLFDRLPRGEIVEQAV